ncbi:DUF4232 domain-containing protein [Streptomyces sp. NPDC001380]|uniref:DUF4232 domain-containing protein n=1 Tax=Streptomyces sp. NPDC001380 TaxID=3364566 RepID=UPI0036ACBFDC
MPSAPVPSAPVPSAPASRGPAGGASGRPAPGGTASAACSPGGLAASGARRLEPSNPDGTYAVLVSLTNRGPGSCVLQGFPSVAVAGQGDPRRNRPLRTVREGAARPVRLAPGGRAWVRVTLVSVLGEGDGYCASGATPAAPPSLVLGVPGGGIQVGVADGGLFAECDDRARTTAFLADRP